MWTHHEDRGSIRLLLGRTQECVNNSFSLSISSFFCSFINVFLTLLTTSANLITNSRKHIRFWYWKSTYLIKLSTNRIGYCTGPISLFCCFVISIFPSYCCHPFIQSEKCLMSNTNKKLTHVVCSLCARYFVEQSEFILKEAYTSFYYYRSLTNQRS